MTVITPEVNWNEDKYPDYNPKEHPPRLESKIKADNRWRKAGIREEVRVYMDNMRKVLRKDKTIPWGQTKELAWNYAQHKYPEDYVPGPDAVPVEPKHAFEKSGDNLAAKEAAAKAEAAEEAEVDTVVDDVELKAESSAFEDVQWVYFHLADKNAKPPSKGARGLLSWARTNKDKFYAMVAQKVITKEMADQASKDMEYKPSKQERRTVDQLRDTFDTIIKESFNRGTGVRVICPKCEHQFEPSVDTTEWG